MGGNSNKGKHNKTRQFKRAAEEGSGLSPESKRPHSPASGDRARSREFNNRGAVSSKLAQSTIDSYVSAAGPASDKGKGGKESTNLPPSGTQAEQSAYPALPGSGGAPPSP